MRDSLGGSGAFSRPDTRVRVGEGAARVGFDSVRDDLLLAGLKLDIVFGAVLLLEEAPVLDDAMGSAEIEGVSDNRRRLFALFGLGRVAVKFDDALEATVATESRRDGSDVNSPPWATNPTERMGDDDCCCWAAARASDAVSSACCNGGGGTGEMTLSPNGVRDPRRG